MLFHGITRSISSPDLEQNEKGVCEKLKLIIWKNWRYRMQHLVLVFAQLGIPIALCFLVSLLGISHRNSLQYYYTDLNLTLPNINSSKPAQNDKHDRIRYEATTHTLLPLTLVLTSLFYPLTLLEPMVVERRQGIKNFLSMRGINGTLQGISWFLNALPLALINVATFVFFVTLPLTYKESILPHSNVAIVFITVFLYTITSLMFCFVFSTYLKNENYSFPLWFLISFVTILIPMAMDEETLFDDEPHFYLCSTVQLIACLLFPNFGLYLAIHVIITFECRDVGMQWWYMNTAEYSPVFFSVTLLHILTIWITSIVFCCFAIWYLDHLFPGRFRTPKSVFFLFEKSYWAGENIADFTTDQTKRASPKNKTLISICNVYKYFNKQCALRDVTLDINYGEISVVLGLTKSGKSTLLSLVAGFERPSDGIINVKGQDISCIQNLIGLCPQNDMLFEYLTVKQHLIFYGRLAGKSGIELHNEVSLILNNLQLQSRQHWYRRWLTKGMRRRLSVGIALIVNNGVIILDEPTLDMEEDARRNVWKLIGEYRRRRCILIATKSVRECIALGGMISILRLGKVRIQGPLQTLKEQTGAKYLLSLRINKNADIAPIVQLVRKYVDVAKMETHTGDKLEFKLPIDSKVVFADMIFELERKRPDLLVHNIDLFVTSIEQALMNYIEPSDDVRMFSASKFGVLRLERNFDYRIFKLTQQQTRHYRSLVVQQILGLLLKRACFEYHRWTLLFPRMIFPVLLITVMLYVHCHGRNLVYLINLFLITQLDYEELTISSPNRTSVAIHQFHSLHSVHFLIILKYVLLSSFIPLALSFIHCSFVIFPIEERVSQSKNLQLLSGVRKSIFWTVTYFWDFITTTLLVYLLIFTILAGDDSGIFAGSEVTGVLVVTLLLSGWATIPFVYFVSFFSSYSCVLFMKLLFFNITIGTIFPVFVLVCSIVGLTTLSAISWVLQWVFRFLPHYSFTMAIIQLVKVTIDVCGQIDPGVLTRVCQTAPLPLEIENCCKGITSKFQQLKTLGIIEELLSLCFCGFFYLFCLWLFDRESKRNKLRYNVKRRSEESNNIEAHLPVYSDRALFVDRLVRRRGNLELVNNVTFHVNCGDCVGLAGPSIATKSTLLRMCVGKEEMDSGEITLYDTNLKHHRRQYLSQIGYCPPNPAVMSYLTIKETLIIHAMLCGVINVSDLVEDLLSVFGLIYESDLLLKDVRDSSRQKLSVALSLVGCPPILFLDQPTNGLDLNSLIQIWKVFKAFTKTDTTIVLAPTSTQECLVLCSRVGMLSGGRLIHFGKLDEIRGDFGDGVTLTIAIESEVQLDFDEIISQLDQFMDAKFDGCTMTRLHDDELCFYLQNYRINWPYLFEMMEEAKEIFQLRNYSIDRTNLNEIMFLLSFRP